MHSRIGLEMAGRRACRLLSVAVVYYAASATPALAQASWQFGTATITASTGASVGIGTSNPQYTLAVNGTIGATQVVVTTSGWSDYVFNPGYHPQSLMDVANYIKQNHHLPGIPSAKEVESDGVNVGEMQAKLLAKIEELTLHMIKAQQRNDHLEAENRALQKRVARLEARSGRTK